MVTNIPEKWQWIFAAAVSLILIAAGALAVRVTRPATPTATPTKIAAAEHPRPTAPPTFTATASPTAPASPTPTATPSPTPTQTPTPAPAPIVLDVTELGYLTSVQYKMQTVIADNRSDENWWSRVFGNDRVLMLAVGNVQAGIDMRAISPGDVHISGDHITLVIPHATINSVELLPNESQVIDSQQKWAFSEYTGLETETLDAARQQLQLWAENEASVLPVAERLAKLQLTEFLQTVGFRTVTITFKEGGN